MSAGRRILVMTAATLGVWPRQLHAQSSSRKRRIGRLSPLSRQSDLPFAANLRQGLADLGWVEGSDYEFDAAFADGRFDRLPALAAGLVQRGVDLIVTGSNLGGRAVRDATSTIPIVMVTTADPTEGGLVASLARPGANLTGVTALGQELIVKRLELLREAFPAIKSVALLVNPDAGYARPHLELASRSAPLLGLRVQIVAAREPAAIDRAFAEIDRDRTEVLMVLPDAMFIDQRARIVALAGRARLPATYGEREFVTSGGLMFYGARLPAMYRHAARLVDRILRGARPSDLPFEQATQFDLVVNLTTARSLGLALSPAILARADEVIDAAPCSAAGQPLAESHEVRGSPQKTPRCLVSRFGFSPRLRELGYEEGRDVVLEFHFANGGDRLASLAQVIE